MQKAQHPITDTQGPSIGPFSLHEYIDQIKSFHGHEAPGVMIGGFMVDLALRHLPKKILFDAVSETKSCLPDAIQILTPCTIGNGWLKVLNIGRFAIILYDKYNGEGIRVYLDAGKMDPWPEIKAWFLKLKPKDQQNQKLLMKQIQDAGTSIMGIQKVRVKAHLLGKGSGKTIAICSSCKEAYPAENGTVCPACMGDSPYDLSVDQ